MKYRILVADDHAIIRDGLKKILSDTPDLEVAGEAADGHALLEQVRGGRWDALVLDLSMPGRNGFDLIRQIRSEQPRLPILVFSMHDEEQYATRAIRAGAAGYLSKEDDTARIVPALHKVLAGGVFIGPAVAEQLASDLAHPREALPHTRLSDREFEIFIRLVRGVSLTAIATEFSLSVKTVSTHKSNILGKMNLPSQVELVLYAADHGLIERLSG